MPSWNDAVKIWNAQRTGKYVIPKKGSDEYNEIRKLMGEDAKPAKPAPTATAPQPIWNEAVKIWNAKRTGKYVAPKKGTAEYEEVQSIVDRLKYPGKTETPTDVVVKRKAPKPKSPPPKPKSPEAVDKDTPVPFMVNGNKMFKNAKDEVYTNKDGKPGLYLGVYNDETNMIFPDDSDEETEELSPFQQEMIRRQKENDVATEASFINLRVATRNSKLSKADKDKFLDKISKDYNEFTRKRDERMAYLMLRTAKEKAIFVARLKKAAEKDDDD